MSALEGLVWVLVTPFGEDGAVDGASLARLVDLAAGAGASGVTALGVNGEAAHLDEAEREEVLRVVLRAAAGRLPVVAGVSAADPALAARRAAAAQAAGAAAAMVAVPPGGEADLDAHLARVAAGAPGLDLVLQDFPASGHPPVPAQALARAAEAVPAVRAVKAEDPPTPVKVAALRALAPGLRQLGGLGGLWLRWELEAGADGTMTGFAVPERLAAVVAAARRGDPEEAARLHDALLPALVWEAQPVVGLALRKVLLAERGVIATPRLRAPGAAPPGAAEQARALLRRLEALEVPA